MKLFKAIESTILCIRFPFLYPRNRFTGKHYNNWKLIEYRENHPYIEMSQDELGEFVYKIVSRKNQFKCWGATIYEKFLSIFHVIPTYTELDAMETGWRNAFGIQMCKELKKALKKQHLLYKYRITQIKEKWGYLRWYDNYATCEIYKIISKYEQISAHTCIVCGKPAKYISRGWISPYCEDCIGDRKDATLITDNYDTISERL